MRKYCGSKHEEEDCTQAHGAAGSCHSGGRCINPQISPDFKPIYFGEDEEDLLIKMHALLGDRWSLIAGRLPGRTEIEVKDYWNSCLKQKLINIGVDPENHRVPAHYRLGCCLGCTASSNTLSVKPKDGNIGKQYDKVASSSVEDDAQSLPGLNLDHTTTYSMGSCVEVLEK